MKINLSTLLIVIFAIAITACTTAPENHDEVNLATVEKYQKALKAQDYETIASLLSDSYVGYGPSIGDSTNRDDALTNYKYNMEHLYKKLEFQGSQNIVVTNYKNGVPVEWVSSWGKLYVKYREHGNEAEIWSNTIFQVKDGKIQKSFIFYNEADALRQAGYKYTFNEPTVIED